MNDALAGAHSRHWRPEMLADDRPLRRELRDVQPQLVDADAKHAVGLDDVRAKIDGTHELFRGRFEYFDMLPAEHRHESRHDHLDTNTRIDSVEKQADVMSSCNQGECMAMRREMDSINSTHFELSNSEGVLHPGHHERQHGEHQPQGHLA